MYPAQMVAKSGKPRTGNPEVSETDLAWLAGIMDGEGSICVYWRKRLDGSKRPLLKVSVANTNWLMIRRVRSLFHQLTGRHYAASEKWQKGQTKRQWQIFLNRADSVIAILSAIRPFMVAKRALIQRAIIVAEWKPGFLPCRVSSRWTERGKGTPDLKKWPAAYRHLQRVGGHLPNPVPSYVLDAAAQIEWFNRNPPQPDRFETVETVRYQAAAQETVHSLKEFRK